MLTPSLTGISIQVHGRLVKNGPDVACLLARGFSPPPDNQGLKTQGDALTCFQVYIALFKLVIMSSS